MNIITRRQAIDKGLSFYFTGKPCKWGHVSERYTSSRKCKVCTHIYGTSDSRKEYAKQYDYKNKHKVYVRRKRYRETHAEYISQYLSNYKKKNPRKHSEYTARRKARKLNATPKWLTEAQIVYMKAFYALCPDGHHVDHIVPLQGKTVCGLHVPWNLQILTTEENLSKGNKLMGEVDNGTTND